MNARHALAPDSFTNGDRWLCSTPLLQVNEAAVRIQAAKLTQLQTMPRDKALRCHAWVRALPLMCRAGDKPVPAIRVLRERAGDGLGKSTLLVALLRASGVPARLRLYSISAVHLLGIESAPPVAVDHAVTEIWLDGRWTATDAYMADPLLSIGARRRLLREHLTCGYGVCLHGASNWNGLHEAHSYGLDASRSFSPLDDWGVFDDPAQLEQTQRRRRVRWSWTAAAQRAVEAALANARLNALRELQ